MPVPKRKRSRARRDSRFANKGMKVQSITKYSSCAAPLATHQACKNCGFYKGEKVLRTKHDRLIERAHVRQAKVSQAAGHRQADVEQGNE